MIRYFGGHLPTLGKYLCGGKFCFQNFFDIYSFFRYNYGTKTKGDPLHMTAQKYISLLLAVLLGALFIFASCASPDTSQTQPPDSESSTEDPAFGGNENTPGNDAILPEPPDSSDEGENEPEEIPPEETPDTPPEPEPVPPDTTPAPKPEPPAPAQDILVESLTNGLNLRSGPGASYASVGNINKGDMVAYVKKSGSWYQTVYKQKTAYISADTKYTRLAYFEKSSARVEKVLEIGKTLMGFPYDFGAQRLHWGNGVLNANFTGLTYDCSSLVQYAFYKGASVNLAATSREQSLQGKTVSKSNLKRGDVMFFTNESRYYLTGTERIGHVAIYIGNNYILHTASDYAVMEPISDKRWSYFITAKNYL